MGGWGGEEEGSDRGGGGDRDGRGGRGMDVDDAAALRVAHREEELAGLRKSSFSLAVRGGGDNDWTGFELDDFCASVSRLDRDLEGGRRLRPAGH